MRPDNTEPRWDQALNLLRRFDSTAILACEQVRRELFDIDPDLSVPVYEVPYLDNWEIIVITNHDGRMLRMTGSCVVVPLHAYNPAYDDDMLDEAI